MTNYNTCHHECTASQTLVINLCGFLKSTFFPPLARYLELDTSTRTPKPNGFFFLRANSVAVVRVKTRIKSSRLSVCPHFVHHKRSLHLHLAITRVTQCTPLAKLHCRIRTMWAGPAVFARHLGDNKLNFAEHLFAITQPEKITFLFKC